MEDGIDDTSQPQCRHPLGEMDEVFANGGTVDVEQAQRGTINDWDMIAPVHDHDTHREIVEELTRQLVPECPPDATSRSTPLPHGRPD